MRKKPYMLCSQLILYVCLLWPGSASADGMMVRHYGEVQEGSVTAPMQRALLWFNDDMWQLVIQPSFERPEGGAAWVVPFPVAPNVKEASSDLLDQLELLTAPIFVPYCEPEQESPGCMGPSAGGGSTGGLDSGSTGPAQSGAQVWDAGSTEQLDWVVLEAPGPEALILWLEENGYEVPVVLEEQPELLDGRYLFAAKLREDQDPTAPLPPMSFSLPGLAFDEIQYPLKLTAQVAPPDGLDLVLWVAYPVAAGNLVPKNLDWAAMPFGRQNPVEWDDNREALVEAFADSGGLVLEYNGSLGSSSILNGEGYHGGEYLSSEGFAKAGLDIPDSWTPEIEKLKTEDMWTMRFRGVITGAGMKKDLAFQTTGTPPDRDYDNLQFFEVTCFQLNLLSQGHDPQRSWYLHLPGALAVLAALAGIFAFAVLRLARVKPCGGGDQSGL